MARQQAKTAAARDLVELGLEVREADAVDAGAPRPAPHYPNEVARLMRSGLTQAEAESLAPDLAAAGNRYAVGYVRTTHPDTGASIVFVPGERLPIWAPSS